MTSLPQDLTADALLKWQDDMEADLERVLVECTEEALSAMVVQAVTLSLTAASARFLWEGAVSQALYRLGLGDDRSLLEELMEANIGDDAYQSIQEFLAANRGELTGDDLKAALAEVLEIPMSLVASGDASFRRRHSNWLDEEGRNWVEQTGTGHLPRYIRAIADALIRRGYGQQRAIATAVNTVKRWARRGPARHGGKGHVTAKTQAKAIKALVEWEAKRIEARATALHKPTKGTMEDKTLEHSKAFELDENELALLDEIILEDNESLVAAGGLMERLTRPVSKWKGKIKRHVRTGFTGVVGRLVLAEMRVRGKRTKTWVTKRDNRVRETHHIADGQTVPIDQPFHVGLAMLQYPGERGGPIEEVANCRCVIVPGDN